jgi:hypothetical protein
VVRRRQDRAEAEARRAIAILEPLPSSSELAMAYSNMAQLRMLAGDVTGTRDWAAGRSTLAERLGYTDVLVHALNNVGSAELSGGSMTGAEKLERSLLLAADAASTSTSPRSTNASRSGRSRRVSMRSPTATWPRIEYTRERDLDSWLVYMTGWKARSDLERGRWEEAAAGATDVVERPRVPNASMIGPLVILGRLRARLGEPDPWEPLDDALALAEATGELQRLGPVAAARAEVHWLTGRLDLVGPETDRALALAARNVDAWAAGELCAWRHRAGLRETPPTPVAEPYRLELAGRRGRRARLDELGCPYDAALARSRPTARASCGRATRPQRLGARVTAAHAAASCASAVRATCAAGRRH